ncbi:uncharacterized protein ISCGN_026160 [Ixodes scapularis]
MARIYLAEFLLHLSLFTGTLMTATSLKLLDVQIPRTVKEGEAVRLTCAYDLGGELPYSTTWTKNGGVFYQSTQSGGKLSPFSGADVNLHQSSASSVLLENVTKELEGQYACEVFTAAPHFHLVRGSGPISVVEKRDATSAGDLRLLGLGVPAYARLGGSARLHCLFKLGSAPLYCVKWYKDNHEFFRYLPSENPPKKIFPMRGLTVNVAESDQFSVLLEQLTLHSGGAYRCEVVTEAPTFEVVTGDEILNVTGDATSAGDLRLLGLGVPAYARLGGSARLHCLFKLGSAPLYCVKWYKDNHEFFRYLPSENPPKKIFPMRGLTVNVAESDQFSVLLEQLTLHSGGAYRCEVVTEAPTFEVVTGDEILNVTAPPKEGPKIRGAQTHYNIGDTVDIACVSLGSRPVVNYSWYLNGLPPDPTNSEISNLATPTVEGLDSSVSRLRFKISDDLFINGTVSIKCVASIPNVYIGSDEKVVHQRAWQLDDGAVERPVADLEREDLGAQSISRGSW